MPNSALLRQISSRFLKLSRKRPSNWPIRAPWRGLEITSTEKAHKTSSMGTLELVEINAIGYKGFITTLL